MDLLIKAKGSFDAGHHLPEIEECSREGHGHRFEVIVISKAIIDPHRGSLPEIHALSAELDLIMAELNGKSLNKMMAGSTPTGPNIAMWILERITVAFPKVVQVRVAIDWRHEYIVERPVR